MHWIFIRIQLVLRAIFSSKFSTSLPHSIPSLAKPTARETKNIFKEERVSFFSEGGPRWRQFCVCRTLRLALHGPGIVQGPGWLGLKDAKLYLRYHEALTEAGFAVLIFRL